jgi:hypothetical protein
MDSFSNYIKHKIKRKISIEQFAMRIDSPQLYILPYQESLYKKHPIVKVLFLLHHASSSSFLSLFYFFLFPTLACAKLSALLEYKN